MLDNLAQPFVNWWVTMHNGRETGDAVLAILVVGALLAGTALIVNLASLFKTVRQPLNGTWREKLMTKKQRAKRARIAYVRLLIGDNLTSMLEESLHRGKLTRDEVNIEYRRLARSLGIYTILNGRIIVHPHPEWLKMDIRERRETAEHKKILPFPDRKVKKDSPVYQSPTDVLASITAKYA